MDAFVPKYRQPFTLEMAIELDVQTLITGGCYILSSSRLPVIDVKLLMHIDFTYHIMASNLSQTHFMVCPTSVASSELSRLEDSVQRLTDTQDTLKNALDEDSTAGRARDPDLLEAYEDNVTVM
jgi:hypothetical protein